MQDILRQAMEENFDKDASVLAKAARVVRNDISKAMVMIMVLFQMTVNRNLCLQT